MLLNEISPANFGFYSRSSDIKHWLNKSVSGTFVIHDDNSVDINGTIHFPKQHKYIPFKVNSISESIIATDTALSSFINFPRKIGKNLYFANTRIDSFKYIPEEVNGLIFMRNNSKKLTSYHNIHHYIKYVGGGSEMGFEVSCDLVPNMLGLFFIKGIKSILIDGGRNKEIEDLHRVEEIFNQYLPHNDVHSCQEALIDAGYPEVARF